MNIFNSGELIAFIGSRKVRTSTWLAFVVVLAIRSSIAQTAPSPSYRFSSGNAAPNIPVELVSNGLVFLNPLINGHAGWFILDNATQGFVADTDYARQISLQS